MSRTKSFNPLMYFECLDLLFSSCLPVTSRILLWNVRTSVPSLLPIPEPLKPTCVFQRVSNLKISPFSPNVSTKL